MRWKPIQSELPPQIDMAYATQLVRDGRHEAHDSYLATLRGYKPVVLPKLQIDMVCKLLRKAIPTAIYLDDGEDVQKVSTDTDDALDAARYTLAAHK